MYVPDYYLPVKTSVKSVCGACGAEFDPNPVGRPRKFCRDCVQSTSDVGGAEVIRQWRQLQREQRAA